MSMSEMQRGMGALLQRGVALSGRPLATTANKKTVQLFYDVISPYSWVAFEVLCRYQQRWNFELTLCPFFLSGIMQSSQNRPPGMVPAKGAYMMKDLDRLSRYYQIPLKPPSNIPNVLFVKGTLQAERLLTAVKLSQSAHEYLEELSRRLWLRIWSRDEDITTTESLRAACREAGLSTTLTNDLIDQIRSDRVKEELKKTTQEALDHGAFGAPFILVHTDGKVEPFFGSDRFELIADTLGEKWEGPLVELKAKI